MTYDNNNNKFQLPILNKQLYLELLSSFITFFPLPLNVVCILQTEYDLQWMMICGQHSAGLENLCLSEALLLLTKYFH